MKTGVLSALFRPHGIGGAEVVAEMEARAARDAGVDVFVITSKPWSGFASLRPEVADQDGLRVYRFFPLNVCGQKTMMGLPFPLRLVWHAFNVWNLHSYWTIRGILRRERPDRILAHNVSGLGFFALRAVADEKIPCTHVLHDYQYLEPFGQIRVGREARIDDGFHRLYQAFCRGVIGSPDRVTAPSKFLLDLHTSRGFFPRSERNVVPYLRPVWPSWPRETHDDGVLRLAYVGVVEEFKGIVFLVEALREFDRPFLLEIVGDGSALSQVRRLTDGDARFVVRGRLSGEELARVYFRNDVLIVPSLIHDNSPTVILQAQAANMRVIASRAGGIPELVPDGDLFRPGDAADLLSVLRTLQTNTAAG